MEGPNNPGRYEIVVAAVLDDDWSSWFEGFDVDARAGTSRLVGDTVDQAALHGVLARLRDLGIPLLSVRRLPRGSDGALRGPRNTPPGT